MCDDPELVVVGVGHVGLALAVEAVRAKLRVCGLDTDVARVAAVTAGHTTSGAIDDEQLRRALRDGLRVTSDPACIATAATVVICVPTPLDRFVPDLRAVVRAAHTVADRVRPGALVVLESTTYPGTTEEVLRPILERDGRSVGHDLYLAYSPERIDPGNRSFGLRNTPKIVGGVTAACAAAAGAFYARLVDHVVPVSSPAVAEMAKLLENTYRQINIALVNEMAVFCHELRIDLWEAIDAAATKPFGFEPFYPGPGVGGHCIPIDPGYLSYRVRTLGYPFRFVELAQEINAHMPAFVVDRIIRLLNDRCLSVRGAKVLLLGVTYKADVADERESPARAVAERLLALRADLSYHDPYIPRWRVADRTIDAAAPLSEAASTADIVVLLQAHRCYDLATLAGTASLFFDTRGRTRTGKVVRL